MISNVVLIKVDEGREPKKKEKMLNLFTEFVNKSHQPSRWRLSVLCWCCSLCAETLYRSLMSLNKGASNHRLYAVNKLANCKKKKKMLILELQFLTRARVRPDSKFGLSRSTIMCLMGGRVCQGFWCRFTNHTAQNK